MITRLSPTDRAPEHGSVVMTQSLTGTAFQRHYSDGLFHSTTGQTKSFSELFTRGDGRECPVYLIYDAATQTVDQLPHGQRVPLKVEGDRVVAIGEEALSG